jgi:FtsH-binding integral membrane protein
MTFEQWMLGVGCAVVVGLIVHALATGRAALSFSEATRRGDPIGYWLAIALLVLMLALAVGVLRQSSSGDLPGPISFLFLTPLFLFSLIEALRTGKVSLLSKEPFRRDDRPAAFWTHVAILVLLVGFGSFVLANGFLR